MAAARRQAQAKQPGGCFSAVIVAAIVLCYQLFGPDDEVTASPEVEPVAVVVPDLAGVDAAAAAEQLSALGHREWASDGEPKHQDLSPKARGLGYQEPWTVITTRPAAGQTWAVGEPIHVFALRTVEWQWFLANPVMPAVPIGVPAVDLIAEGQILHAVEELVDNRYAPGYEPPSMAPHPSGDVPIDGLVDDPSLEPASERAERDLLVPASWATEAPAIRTIPPVGAPLRMGQLLTVVVGDDPYSSYSADGGGAGGYGYGDGDDGSVNVPGWACPTRWC